MVKKLRLIDADALPRHGQRGGLVHWQDIENAPTINAVPKQHLVNWAYVTRCKDCKQYNGKIECGNGLLTEPDDFCSFGVRKEAKHETD